jgi:hypothetical protein
MTNERRILIAPADIISIGVECPHCRATYFVPIDKLDRALPGDCRNCHETFFSDAMVLGSDFSNLDVLASFINFFKLLRGRGFGSSVRFEIKEEVNRKDQP